MTDAGTVASAIASVLALTTRARSYFCVLCRTCHMETLEEARQRWPLAAALYEAFLLPEPGFRGEATPDGRALIAVERTILDKLGVASLEGRGDDDVVAYIASRARGRFVMSGGRYRFPRRRCCLLLGPRKADVLALLGVYCRS